MTFIRITHTKIANILIYHAQVPHCVLSSPNSWGDTVGTTVEEDIDVGNTLDEYFSGIIYNTNSIENTYEADTDIIQKWQSRDSLTFFRTQYFRLVLLVGTLVHMVFEQFQDVLIAVTADLAKLHASGGSHLKIAPKSVMLTAGGSVILGMSFWKHFIIYLPVLNVVYIIVVCTLVVVVVVVLCISA